MASFLLSLIRVNDHRESKQVLRVMLVDIPAIHTAMLEEEIEEAGYELIACLKGPLGLLKAFIEAKPELLVINLDTPDKTILDTLQIINRDYPCPIVIFTNDDDSSVIQLAIRAGVSAYVVDGLLSNRIKPVIDVALARFTEMQSLRSERDKAKSSLQERKLIDKAKGLIMAQRQVTEDVAYASLRKAAMEANKKLIDVAREIISVMELMKS